MTKPTAAGPPATTLSPYLSIRQAVRPAIFTYALLSRQQKLAESLAQEANDLLELTEDLLSAIGLVHLLSPDTDPRNPRDTRGDQEDRLLAAYATAGMLWAKIVGISLAFADRLMEQARWRDAELLAGFLHDAGETKAAENVRTRMDDERRKQLGVIHSNMSREEIEAAIDMLRDLPKDFPQRRETINSRLQQLAKSMVACANGLAPYTVRYVAGGDAVDAPASADRYLAELSAVYYGSLE